MIASTLSVRRAFEMLQRGFYQKLLKVGIDPREEGLMWIISWLRTRGDQVGPDDLPDFLDAKAKQFLLTRAANSQKIAEEKTLLEIQTENYKIHYLGQEILPISKAEQELLDLLEETPSESIASGQTSLAMQIQDNEDERERQALRQQAEEDF